MPNYNLKPLKILIASSIAIALSACTPAPSVKDDQAKNSQEVSSKPAEKAQPAKPLTLKELTALRNQAVNTGNWAQYLIYSQEIWNKSLPEQQAKLEEQAWSIVNSLSTFERRKLANSDNAHVVAWANLYNLINGRVQTDEVALLNLQTFDAQTMFNKHLLPNLLAQKPAANKLNKIAVLLPMQGKYQIVSEQIRNGITKAYFATGQKATLEFFDSTDLNELELVYTQAKQSGADRIIGPLRKQAVQILASFHDNSMLALNTVDNAKIPQFNFKSANPYEQMVARFKQQNYKRIGIMTNDNPRNMADAQTLQTLWQQTQGNWSQISTYPDENPRLRDALGSLIHENKSKERKNNIAWTIHAKLSFFARTRDDLDAIVILDDTQRMSVFNPQFDFFALDTPLYSDSQLTPRKFQEIMPNKDLKDVQFLTYPAIISPENLENQFEAFGWDSYMVSTHFDVLNDGACLTGGKTGVLYLDNMEIKQQQVWVKYNREGLLEDAPLVMANKVKTKKLLRQQEDADDTNGLDANANTEQTSAEPQTLETAQ